MANALFIELFNPFLECAKISSYLICTNIKGMNNLFQIISRRVEEGFKYSEIAGELNISMSKLNRILKNNHYVNPRLSRNNLIRATFSIEDELSAYIAGYLWADGSMSGNRLTIAVKTIDDEFIHLINQYFYGTFIAYRYSKIRNIVTFRLTNKEIADDLKSLGFALNDFRHLPKMDSVLYRHFIRGYFDGDGSISNKNYRATISWAGRMFQMHELGKMLNEIGLTGFFISESTKSKRNSKIKKVKNYGHLLFHNPYKLLIYYLFYHESSFFLKRKKKIFEVSLECINLSEYLPVVNKFWTGASFSYNEPEINEINATSKYLYPVKYHREMKIQERLLEYKPEITDLLKKRYPRKRIAERFNTNMVSLDRFIKEHNIFSKNKLDSQYLYENFEDILSRLQSEEETIEGLHKSTGISKKLLIRKFRKYLDLKFPEVNFDFIKRPSPERAYFLGYLWGRGTLTQYHQKLACQITVPYEEEQHFSKVLRLLYGEITPKLKFDDSGSGKRYHASIANKHFITYLRKLNFGRFEDKDKLPVQYHDQFFMDFIRGYYDAKGEFRKSSIRISGGKKFITSISNSLSYHKIYVSRKEERDITDRIVFNKESSIALTEFMYYSNKSLCLEYNKPFS